MSFPNPPPGPHGPPPFHHGPPPPNSPFWDFIASQTQNGPNTGFGVDHTSTSPPHGFAFGPGGFNAWSGPHGFNAGWGGRGRGGGPPWFARGRGGRHGRGRDRSGDEQEEEDLYDITTAAAAAEREMEQGVKEEGDGEKDGDAYADPPETIPEAPEGGRRRGCRGRRGGFFGRGRGRRHGPPFGGPPFGGPPFGGPPFGGPPPWAMGGAGDWFTGLMEGFGNHPFAQRVREYVEQARRRAGHEEGVTEEEEGEEGVFAPPVDVFDTVNNWTVHLAIPGAKKEDISVRWDADKNLLMISGVVHRPGDEEFIGSMVRGERKVGMFERKIQLPPVETENEKNDEVDGDHITAKMEDGILVILVPKAEKEWTDIKKVDIL